MENEYKKLLFKQGPDWLKSRRRWSPALERRASREGAVQAGPVKVLALSGMPDQIVEYLDSGRTAWTFEPHPDMEKQVAKDNPEGMKCFEISGRMGKEKLWKALQESVVKIGRATGVELDIELLTPGQAVAVIADMLTEKIKFEDLCLDDAWDKVQNSEAIVTSRPDLLRKGIGKEKFEAEIKKMGDNMDAMTADQVIGGGFGVCRHIAAVATVLYKLLKERQAGTMLDGTYLIYHGENVGRQPVKAVVGQHSYNLLVVTAPTGEVEISTLDFTWMLGGDEVDKTWERLSQTCAFLSEYGQRFLKVKVEVVVDEIVREVVSRMKGFFIRENLGLYRKKDKPGVLTLLDDYVSLVDQGSIGRYGGALIHTVDMLEKEYGMDRVGAIVRVLETVPYNINDEGMAEVRVARNTELVKMLETVDFGSGNVYLHDLFYLLDRTANSYHLDWVGDWGKKKDPDVKPTMILMGFLVKAGMVMGERAGEKDTKLVITKAVEINEKVLVDENLRKYGRDYLKTLG